jgi:hypothetical protein
MISNPDIITPYGISEELRLITKRMIQYSGDLSNLVHQLDLLRKLVEENWKNEIEKEAQKEYLERLDDRDYRIYECSDNSEVIAKIQELQRQLTTNKPTDEMEC